MRCGFCRFRAVELRLHRAPLHPGTDGHQRPLIGTGLLVINVASHRNRRTSHDRTRGGLIDPKHASQATHRIRVLLEPKNHDVVELHRDRLPVGHGILGTVCFRSESQAARS